MNVKPTKNQLKWMKLMRKWAYFKFSHCAEPQIEPSGDATVDVVIPVIEKDLDVLPLCLEGLRRCMTNRLGKIYLVGPESKKLRQAAASLGCEFVDETTVLGYGPRQLNVVTADGQNRSGWIYQQLLKLSGSIGQSDYFLVIDADHILIAPHTFVAADGRSVLYMSRELNPPYYEWMARVMDLKLGPNLSYVAHKMVFERRRLAEMRNRIEQTDGSKRWDEIILSTLDRSTQSGFSEYETYGHWLADDKKIMLPWRQKTLRKEADGDMPGYETLVDLYGEKYRSVTFPDYLSVKSPTT